MEVERPITGPMALDALEVSGATRFGTRVAHVIMVMDDGRNVSIDLPSLMEIDDEAPVLTEKQQAIAAVVNAAKAGDILSNEEIAKRAGYSATDDLRIFVRTLAAIGKLKKVNRGWQKT